MKKLDATTIGAMTTNSGKTTFTLGLLALSQKKGVVSSFKVGPDFIDPMFHNVVLKNTIYNLDSFFESESSLNKRFSNAIQKSDYAVVEGVMGHLDGLSDGSASTDEVAAFVRSPVTLLVEEKPTIRTLAAMVDGVVKHSRADVKSIVITKSRSEKLFQMQKEAIEGLTGVPVAGRLPYDEGLKIPSRHLGLDTDMIKLKDTILTIAERCATLINDNINLNTMFHQIEKTTKSAVKSPLHQSVKTAAISKDEAFCFMYKANIEWLEQNGYDIVYFSPMRDKTLPDADFYYLCGGYPEIYLKELSENKAMLRAIKEVCYSDHPLLAECGGYMYLHETLEDKPLVGFFEGHAGMGKRMSRRFGYEYLSLPDNFIFANKELRGHEFHYGFIENGKEEDGIKVRKASNGLAFVSGHFRNNTLGSFSHLYFPSFGRM